ncbi:SRPBCC family protein [Actinokineospora sp. NBRC 105648]|uniref:SRPBCC family protein n=1 Tax=Actinokineospora sp. NBRC 105648 TaxID=3032206 RepID=UPI002555A6F9|nr:SRPBCC family protein [Actinokineospora sp. NBRC 105648]
MATVRAQIPASPAQVWAILADGWTYASWVVGASHIRRVEEGWPAVGTRIHHSVGAWPAVIQDSTRVLVAHPGSLLELEARVWPAGTAVVRLELAAVDGGTEVTMVERVVRGPMAVLPSRVLDVGLAARNREALGRLGDLAVRGA